MKAERLQWERVGSNHDLRLVAATTIGADVRQNLERLLGIVKRTESWGRNFCEIASAEFDRWLENPDTPLQEQAYARLSNWFLCELEWVPRTPLGIACGDFWDALFSARPDERLTHPDEDAKIRQDRFDLWWPQ